MWCQQQAPRGASPLLLPRRELAGGDGQLLLHNHLSTSDNMLELSSRRHLGKKNAFTTAEAPGRASPSSEPKMCSKIKRGFLLTLACTEASSARDAGQILPVFTGLELCSLSQQRHGGSAGTSLIGSSP